MLRFLPLFLIPLFIGSLVGGAVGAKMVTRSLSGNGSGNVLGICTGGNCDATSSGVPSGSVMFFKPASGQSSCPTGWSEYTAARGRYLVGLPQNGTIEKTDGTALTDGEDRPTGQHQISINPPAVSTGILHGTALVNVAQGGGGGNSGYPVYYSDSRNPSTQPADVTIPSTNIAIPSFNVTAGSVAGTNAPYLELLSCIKN